MRVVFDKERRRGLGDGDMAAHSEILMYDTRRRILLRGFPAQCLSIVLGLAIPIPQDSSI